MSDLSPIGIDLDGGAVRAAQRLACGTWRTATLSGLGGDRVPNAGIVGRYSEVLWRRGFVGRAVRVHLPDAAVIEAAVETPPPESGAPIRDIAAAELARFYDTDPSRIEASLVALHDRPRRGDGFRAHAIGVRDADIEACTSVFDETGDGSLHLDAITAGPSGVASLAIDSCASGTVCVVIEPRWTTTRVTIIASQDSADVRGTMLVARRLDDLGLAELSEGMSEAMWTARIADEFSSVLVFLTRLRPELERVSLLALDAPERADRVMGMIGARRELGALVDPVAIAGDMAPTDPRFFRAAACALGIGLMTGRKEAA